MFALFDSDFKVIIKHLKVLSTSTLTLYFDNYVFAAQIMHFDLEILYHLATDNTETLSYTYVSSNSVSGQVRITLMTVQPMWW